MAARKGNNRQPTSLMTDAHRVKIQNSNILNALVEHTLGIRDMSATQVTAGVALLRKIMPDLAATELSGGIANYVARLPQPAKTVDDWQASVRPTEGQGSPLPTNPVPEGTKH